YWILFQLRQLSPPRITEIPSPPSTNWRRSSSASASASRELEGMGSRFLFPRHETIGATPAGSPQPGPAPIVSVRLRGSLTVRRGRGHGFMGLLPGHRPCCERNPILTRSASEGSDPWPLRKAPAVPSLARRVSIRPVKATASRRFREREARVARPAAQDL